MPSCHIYAHGLRRRRVAARYDELLDDVGDVVTPKVGIDRHHLYHLYVIRTENRDNVRTHLTDAGIATVLNYPKALPFYSAYAYLCHGPEDFPNAYANQYRILSLPIYPEIPDEAIKEVASEIKNALELTTGRPRSQAVAEPILNRI